jgi:uncharacterized HAD superfamily protein
MKNKDECKIIAFDLDGVICQQICVFPEKAKHVTTDNVMVCYYPEDCRWATPNWLVVNRMREIQADPNYWVMIYTARDEEFRKDTKAWLKDFNIPYDEYNDTKSVYDWLIDDNAINVKDF